MDPRGPLIPRSEPPPPPLPPAPSNAPPLDGVRAIFERYRETIEAQVDRVEAAAVLLLEGDLAPDVRRDAERDAHKLAGSLGTFGYGRASKVAREIEYLLQGSEVLTQQDSLRLSELVVDLRRALDDPATAPNVAPDQGLGPAVPSGAGPDELPDRRVVLLLGGEADLTQRVSMEMAGRGLEGVVIATAIDARARLAAERPTAVLLDLGLGPGRDAGLMLLGEITARLPAVPVIVLTDRDSLTDRVEVARRGGSGFLQKPQTPTLIVDVVIKAIEGAESNPATVVAVDDDPLITEALRALLEPQQMRVAATNDPRLAWDLIEENDPDLIILDIDMPHLSGIELCRTLRNDPRWAATPVLFLTARNDAETITEVFGAGADDFVSKPVVPAEFLARVTGRLERVELIRNLTEKDLLTRLDTRRKSSERINNLIKIAQRLGQPVALAAIDIDGLRSINEHRGHQFGDKALRRFGELARRHLGPDDVIGRWAGEEFVAALYGMSRDDGVLRLAALLDDVRSEGFGPAEKPALNMSFSAGVAVYPDDGADLDGLYAVADATLKVAKAQGRDRVIPAGWDPAGIEKQRDQVDVVVVEDDAPVAELLLHTLETRGFSTAWLDDGTVAVDKLAGSAPALRGKVLLLDIDLPGLDGLSILKGLADGRVLDRTKVIMLTVRSAEVEVLRAMELGAFDHVAKPFSTPVLMQRIRRAMDALK